MARTIKDFKVTFIGKAEAGSDVPVFLRTSKPSEASGAKPKKFLQIEVAEATPSGLSLTERKTFDTRNIFEDDKLFDAWHQRLTEMVEIPGVNGAAPTHQPVHWVQSPTDVKRRTLKTTLRGAMVYGQCEPSWMVDADGKFIEPKTKHVNRITGEITYPKVRSTRTTFALFFEEGDLEDESYVQGRMDQEKSDIEELIATDIEQPVPVKGATNAVDPDLPVK